MVDIDDLIIWNIVLVMHLEYPSQLLRTHQLVGGQRFSVGERRIGEEEEEERKEGRENTGGSY